MKKVLAIIFSILSCLCLFTGCKKGWHADEHKFLYERMNEISIEDDNYSLNGEWNMEGQINLNEIEMIHTLQGEQLTITYVGIEESSNEMFNIKYKECDITVNIKFMEDRSDAYVKIHNIWNEKIEDYNRKSKIAQFKVYDNRFFIITCGLDFGLSGSVWGEMPYCLYYYDFDTDTIKYCGFFSGEYDEEFGSYYGFIRQQGFAISLK